MRLRTALEEILTCSEGYCTCWGFVAGGGTAGAGTDTETDTGTGAGARGWAGGAGAAPGGPCCSMSAGKRGISFRLLEGGSMMCLSALIRMAQLDIFGYVSWGIRGVRTIACLGGGENLRGRFGRFGRTQGGQVQVGTQGWQAGAGSLFRGLGCCD